ncbi:unknown [Firmicutes bacterium CAG:137]|jgi:hypothetical protein|nr:unknown [Firmicutes bacterium CAG:137]
MSEAEKAIGRTLAEAVNRIPTAAGQKYFLGFAEGAAAMATELGAVVPTSNPPVSDSTTHPTSAQS